MWAKMATPGSIEKRQSRIAGMVEAPQPIIKKKKVVAGGGHHGGAWKVAYADFVTAMMAFFLLMWLLNATTEDQRKGIADYFNPTIPLSRISGGGSEALSGDSIMTQQTLSQSGTGTRGKEDSTQASEGKDDKVIAETKSVAEERVAVLEKVIADSKSDISEHLQIKMSPEGIVIEITESDGGSLFSSGNAQPSELLEKLMVIVATAFSGIENDIRIVGHTDATPFGSNADYTNWELSSDRANTARRLMVAAGFSPSQIAEVAGKADTDPLLEDIYAAENRRISLTILSE